MHVEKTLLCLQDIFSTIYYVYNCIVYLVEAGKQLHNLSLFHISNTCIARQWATSIHAANVVAKSKDLLRVENIRNTPVSFAAKTLCNAKRLLQVCRPIHASTLLLHGTINVHQPVDLVSRPVTLRDT